MESEGVYHGISMLSKNGDVLMWGLGSKAWVAAMTGMHPSQESHILLLFMG